MQTFLRPADGSFHYLLLQPSLSRLFQDSQPVMKRPVLLDFFTVEFVHADFHRWIFSPLFSADR